MMLDVKKNQHFILMTKWKFMGAIKLDKSSNWILMWGLVNEMAFL